jgi:hypothetical protein
MKYDLNKLSALARGYFEMAADRIHEGEALEWSEGLLQSREEASVTTEEE